MSPIEKTFVKKSFFELKESYRQAYQSVNELVREIKGMGARNASALRNRALGGKKVWRKMNES